MSQFEPGETREAAKFKLVLNLGFRERDRVYSLIRASNVTKGKGDTN